MPSLVCPVAKGFVFTSPAIERLSIPEAQAIADRLLSIEPVRRITRGALRLVHGIAGDPIDASRDRPAGRQMQGRGSPAARLPRRCWGVLMVARTRSEGELLVDRKSVV